MSQIPILVLSITMFICSYVCIRMILSKSHLDYTLINS